MNVQSLSLLTVFLCFSIWATAQTALTDSLQALQELIEDVRIGTDDYQQLLVVEDEAPYRIEHTIVEIDSKGREDKTAFLINLALIDPNLIRYEDGKDQIRVNLGSGRDPVVKVFEDDELKDYDDEAYLLATNIDNARAMERLLRNIVPLAEKSWETATALPTTYDELKAWVQDEVGPVTIEDDQWDQQWRNNTEHPSRVVLNVRDDREDEYEYRFNLADLHAPAVKVQVKNKEIKVEFATRKRAKYIQVTKNGEPANFQSDLELIFEEVDAAQVMAHALRDLIPLAEDAVKNLQPQYDDVGALLEALQSAMPQFRQGETSFEQQLSGDCLAQLDVIEEDDKNRNTNTYIFNFSDLNTNAVEIEVRGQDLTVTAATAKKDNYVYCAEDGEQENYDDEVSIAVPDLPTAKLIQYQIQQLAEQCSDEVAAESADWIAEQLSTASSLDEDFEQELELSADEACKWILLQQEVKGKNIDEQRFEFNLYDLDARRVAMEVKGKTVSVVVPTLKNEEIIKNYRNSEELGYAEELTLRLSDIAAAKSVVASLRALIDGCEE